tara:strand:+ start:201 stop:365 length:165 start_codon:yes stop_codon:yes gene_type:complete
MLTKEYKYSIINYKYINKNYILTNYEIYKKMKEENKDISWAYNICFIEKYLGKK